MSQSDIEKIKERLGIKELVESYIKLEKAGKNFKGRCPFHNEKTPSFFVSPDRDNYYCFGCGAKGDIFTFVEQFEGVNFIDALKVLANRTGVKISNYSKEAEDRNKKIKEILELSTKYFEYNLSQKPEVLKYLKNRGLTEKTIKEWRIGFAPNGWHNLIKFLLSKKYTEDEILRSGVIKKSGSGRVYDTFRSRIIFPIFNSVGQIVAFTGRTFGVEDSAKYLNSPETELFKKSEILYGFHVAKSNIRKNDFAILVEGQVDTVMCHQAGYVNTVASSGTALTDKQLESIFRISPRIVVAYDSDSAGFKASEKAWQMALSLGADVKIAPMPEGMDPADIILKDIEEWKEIIKDSRHIIEVLIGKIKRENNDERGVGKAVSTEVIPYLRQIESEIDKAHFVKLLSEEFQIPEEAIYAEMDKGTDEVKNVDSKEKAVRSKDEFAIEKKLFSLVVWQEKEEEPVVDTEEIKKEMKEILGKQYEIIKRSVADSLDDLIFTLESSYDDEKVIRKDVKELLVNLRVKYLVQQRERLLSSLKVLEKSGDEIEADKLLKKIDGISKEIQKLNQNF